MAYLIDKMGNRVGSATYKHILPFSEGLAPFQDEHTSMWGILRLDGSVAIAASYQECKGFSEGLAAVKFQDKWGYIDSSNQVVIPFIYDWARHFNEGYASVLKIIEGENKWGIIDKKGVPITKFKYKFVVGFSEGIAGVCEENRFTCVDSTGKELFEPAYKMILPYENGYALAIEPGNKYSLLDRIGNKVLSGFDGLSDLKEGVIGACKDGLWGFVDISGKTIIPFIYNEVVNGFENGFCCVKLDNNRFGFIDRNEQTVVPFVLKEVIISNRTKNKLHQKTLAVVALDIRKGFVNLENKVVEGYMPPPLRPKYDVKKFVNSYGIIRPEDGEVVLPFNYSDVRPYNDGLAKVSLGTKTGYVDGEGKWVIPLGNYGIASSFCEGRAIADMEYSHRETTHKI